MSVAVLGGLTAAEILGGAGAAVGGIVLSPVFITVVAGAFIVTGSMWVYNNWDNIRGSVSSGWNSAKEFGTSAWNSAKELGTSAWDSASSFATTTWDSLTGSKPKTKSKEKTAKDVPATGGNPSAGLAVAAGALASIPATGGNTSSDTGSSTGSIAGLAGVAGALASILARVLENVISSLAFIVYEMTGAISIPAISTATATWEDATAIPKARDTVSGNYKRGIKKLDKKLVAAAALAADATIPEIRDEEVYLISMLTPGLYNARVFLLGEIPNTFEYSPGREGRHGDPRYKYGTTKVSRGVNRYSGEYIGDQIIDKRMLYTTLVSGLTGSEARRLEKALIYGYVFQYGFFPPGNSKLG